MSKQTKPRILVVDDEPELLDETGQALRLAGFDVDVASSPTSALNLADQNTYDVAVADLVMSPTSGIELLFLIKKACPFVRTILLSGKLDHRMYSVEDMKNDVKVRVDCDEYLVKDANPHTLIDAIKRLTTQEGQGKSKIRTAAEDYVRMAGLGHVSVGRLDRKVARYVRKKKPTK